MSLNSLLEESIQYLARKSPHSVCLTCCTSHAFTTHTSILVLVPLVLKKIKMLFLTIHPSINKTFFYNILFNDSQRKLPKGTPSRLSRAEKMDDKLKRSGLLVWAHAGKPPEVINVHLIRSGTEFLGGRF